MKTLFRWETWDHPVVHAFLMTLMIIPAIVLIYFGADKLGVPLPALGQPVTGGKN